MDIYATVMDNYTLAYNQETGTCIGIHGKMNDSPLIYFIPLIETDILYQNFLIWNATQSPPLDPAVPDPVISARYAAKQSAITTNIPSWTQVETACDNISNLAEAKAFLKKLSRVVYWLAKNSES